MSGSLRYNLDPFHEALDDEIKKALAYSQIENKILNVDNLEDVSHFSNGEKQLVALARSIFKTADIKVEL